MSESVTTDLLGEAAQLARHTHVDDVAQKLLSLYYRHVALADIQQRSPVDLLGAVLSHLRLGASRQPGTAAVRVYTPTEEEFGWSIGHSVVEIVTDDMPFLVDSVSLSLVADGREVFLVIHPVLYVRRDMSGALIEILDTEPTSDEHDVFAESWIHVEIDRATEDCEALTRSIVEALSDVREAVEDWPRMRERAVNLAADLRNSPPLAIPEVEAREAAALLEWLAADNFTFLGSREYELVGDVGQEALAAVPGTGLGILRADQEQSRAFAKLPAEVRALSREPRALVLTKANSRSTVHRAGYLDYVGVKKFDEQGEVIGEYRFLGLYAASAYTQPVSGIPVVRLKADRVFQQTGVPRNSHTGKAIQHFLETFPREELFWYPPDELTEVSMSVHQMSERRQTRLFAWRDPYGRFVSCLVYLPRDRYTTAVRLRIQKILVEAFGGMSIDHSARVSESVLARLHFVVRIESGHQLLKPDVTDVEERVAHAVRSWDDDFLDSLDERVGDVQAARISRMYRDGFPEGYKEDFTPRAAVSDVLAAQDIDSDLGMHLHLYEPIATDPMLRRLKIFRENSPISLSTVLPVLNSLGVEVLDERPYEVERKGAGPLWIYDFGMNLGHAVVPDRSSLAERFQSAFQAAWMNRTEVDNLNGLVVAAGLTWRQVSVLRSYTRYLRQTGTSFAPSDIERALLTNISVSGALVRLFETRLNPREAAQREDRTARLIEGIRTELDHVVSLDEDRILRSLLGLVTATLRTNYFRPTVDGQPRHVISMKFDPHKIDDLPLPKPRFEMWVYSPQVEGVHLRFGSIARGGLRWSDRRADFRTEILGLVKAQQVKNAVIVPVGAKGGFVPKNLPDPGADRAAWLAEGQSAYREFISAMLDITDNLVEGQVVAPPDVVRHDGDDPYLVVAADKGTATFSDLANSIAADYEFWLDDAFASGGSDGYDHKAMGITARGAWESVKRHFRELGTDTQTQNFTAIGIGDMSGDVFGNGMLLSEHIRLIAAFDHRHIFIDPDPDPAISYAERERLFQRARSSWADYDTALISEGGGVFPRYAKSIPLTSQIRRALAIDESVEAMIPTELIRHILMAPVDLLWNGGIGTYVKAQTETAVEVGDKANDAVRIDGCELRCLVVGEGGNLGFTQLGRIEAARSGIKINTDAIDNSAGVDTSDHEVNIKILLDEIVRAGDLTLKQRNALLVAMTDEVAALVLRDNYDQNVLLGNARRGAVSLVSVHGRMIRDLEARGILDRAIEFLPADDEIATRAAAGQGLTSPELAVLAAYAKISLADDLDPGLAEEPWSQALLVEYFPSLLVEQWADRLSEHPLRKGIVTTAIVNDIVNHGGITLVFRACEETGASATEVVRAAIATIGIFDLRDFWHRVDALDNQVPTNVQCALHLESRRLLDRGIRWFLQNRGGTLDIATEIETFAATVSQLTPMVESALRGVEHDRFEQGVTRFVEMQAPLGLAEEASAMLDRFALLDVVQISQRSHQNPAEVLDLYFALSERYDVDRFLGQITALGRSDRWTALARQALRSDLYSALAGFTLGVLRSTAPGRPCLERIEEWEAAHAEGLARARTTLDDIARQGNADLAMLSVALRVLRSLVAQARLS